MWKGYSRDIIRYMLNKSSHLIKQNNFEFPIPQDLTKLQFAHFVAFEDPIMALDQLSQILKESKTDSIIQAARGKIEFLQKWKNQGMLYKDFYLIVTAKANEQKRLKPLVSNEIIAASSHLPASRATRSDSLISGKPIQVDY
jgi:hypothetical protein